MVLACTNVQVQVLLNVISIPCHGFVTAQMEMYVHSLQQDTGYDIYASSRAISREQ